MYYTFNEETDEIIDVDTKCPDPQKKADFFKCSVYIVRGEHTGLRADPYEKHSMESQDDD